MKKINVNNVLAENDIFRKDFNFTSDEEKLKNIKTFLDDFFYFNKNEICINYDTNEFYFLLSKKESLSISFDFIKIRSFTINVNKHLGNVVYIMFGSDFVKIPLHKEAKTLLINSVLLPLVEKEELVNII